MVALLFVAVGAVSATASPGWVINMQPDTTLDLVCQGGYMEAIVDNNSQPAVTHVTCYSFLPPGPAE
jgi:hypothetical protein